MSHPRGGAGKTTIATNIAYIFAKLGYKVVVVDADHQCNASAEFMMRMYHVFGSIDGSYDSSTFNLDSYEDLTKLYLAVKEHASNLGVKNISNKDKYEKFMEIYLEYFDVDDEMEEGELKKKLDKCLLALRAEGQDFASAIQAVASKVSLGAAYLKYKVLAKRTDEQAIKSAIAKIRDFYRKDTLFIGKYGEGTNKQAKGKVARSHLPTSNLMRLLTRLTDLKVQNRTLLYKLARDSKLMDFTKSYSISGEGELYLFPGSLFTDRVNMDPNWSNNSEHNKKLTFFNLSHILRLIAGNVNADLVIIDQNPGANALNQSLWAGSDYIIVPFEPSFFSSFSIEVLFATLESWYKEIKTSHALFVAGEDDIDSTFLRNFDPAKIMGTVISKLPKTHTKEGSLSTFESKKFWVEEINRIMAAALKRMQANSCGELICPNMFSSFVSRFDRSNEVAQKWGVPISASHLLRAGLNLTKKNLQQYKDDFLALVNHILQKIVADPRISDKKREQIMEVGFGYFHRSYLGATGSFFFGVEKNYSNNALDKENFTSDLYIYDYLDIWLLLCFQKERNDLRICLDLPGLTEAIKEDRQLFKEPKYKRIYIFFHELKWRAVTISKHSSKGTCVFDNCDPNSSYVKEIGDFLKRSKMKMVAVHEDYSSTRFIKLMRDRLASNDDVSTKATRSNASEEKQCLSSEEDLRELIGLFVEFKESSKSKIKEIYDRQKIFLTELNRSLAVTSIEEMGKIYSKYFSSYDKKLFKKTFVSNIEKNVFMHLIHITHSEEDDEHVKTLIKKFVEIRDSYEYIAPASVIESVGQLGDFVIGFKCRRADREGNIYNEVKIVGDGSCGFHAANISREDAVNALKNQQGDARDLSRREILQELFETSVEDSEVAHLKGPLQRIVTDHRGRIKTAESFLTELREQLASDYEVKHITIHEGNSAENLYKYALSSSQKTELEQRFIRAYEVLYNDHLTTWFDSEDAKNVYDAYIELFRCNTRNLWVGTHFLRNACRAQGIGLKIWYVHAENGTIYSHDTVPDSNSLVHVVLSGGHFNRLLQESKAINHSSPVRSNKRRKKVDATPRKRFKSENKRKFQETYDSDPASAGSDSGDIKHVPSSNISSSPRAVQANPKEPIVIDSDSSDISDISDEFRTGH